jgi:hypothetical protein
MTTKKGCWFDRAGRGSQPVPRLLLPAIAMLIVAAITTGLAARGDFQGRDDDRDDEREGRSEYAIGLWGDLLTALRDQVIAFRKPVAYVHGDSHYFRRQAVARLPGPPARELHSRRDVRRQRGERQQRRALVEGARGCAQPRGVRVPAADRSGEPDCRSSAIIGCEQD